MSRPARLCIFTRAPVLGTVKRRLARAVGSEVALAAHEQLVALALQQLADVPGLAAQLWVAGPVDHPGVAEWSRRWGLPVIAQRGADLGARMYHAVQTCLADGASAIVVGTDCPNLDADYVQLAAEGLMRHDMVLGPAEDGGYGLIALGRDVSEVFDGIRWGTSTVLEETLNRARACGLSCHLLEPVWDVDEVRDWERFLASR